MRKFIVLALSTLFSLISFSQTSSIKGTVVDTSDNKNLQNTLISVMRSKDSVLVKFTRADRTGNFAINNLDTGKFVLLITHPYLGDYFDNIFLRAGETNELGKIPLISKSKLLSEVIVKSGAPIRIKGDTTIYTADSFKVRAGANVEELLRTMPGIQVDKDGKIIAMGERVTKVLVDGEEFFGTDPGIATKNLRADIVQEVQVFDKKSDQAEFTGIDDGIKDKTINLKLKEDKKKGYFGKIEAGGGLKDKYNNSAMLNAFQGKRKIAGYGIMSNTGQTNLDWQDAQNYGGGGGMTDMTDEGYIMFGGGDEDGGNYWGGRNGIPKNWNAGAHYSNKFNNNKQSLNAGYKFSKVNSPGVTSTFSKNFLKDTSWFNNSRSENYSSTIKHGFNLTVETTLDSMNSLKWTTKANNNDSRTSNDYYSETLNEAGHFINNNKRISTNEATNNSLTSSLLWKKKFKKLARTLSVNTDFNFSNSNNEGLLQSRINYFADGNFQRYDSIDQQNIRDNSNKSIGTKISYTEPLMKDVYMEISYGLNYSSTDNDRITNTRSGNGKYETRVDSLSNSFSFDRFVYTPGLNFRVNKKKINFSLGNSVGFNHFVQKNNTEDQRYNYNFVNFFPRATFQYKIKPNENLRVNYSGSSTAPSLEQLQPIRVNTDPLNIYIGNQDLRQSFRHNASASYNTYNPLSQRSIWSNLSFSTTQNSFTQLSIIDSGVRTTQTVNASGPYNINFYGDYGFAIKGTKLRLGISPTFNTSQRVEFVRNGKLAETVKNTTTSTGYGMGISTSFNLEKKLSFYMNSTVTQNISKASVNAAADIKYWQFEAWGEATLTLPAKFELRTDVNTEIRQKDPNFPANNSFTKWNAALTKRFFKDNALELRLSIFDILNQNRGYDRNFNSSSFTETYYNTLKRFGGLSIIWNISKNGKPVGF